MAEQSEKVKSYVCIAVTYADTVVTAILPNDDGSLLASSIREGAYRGRYDSLMGFGKCICFETHVEGDAYRTGYNFKEE